MLSSQQRSSGLLAAGGLLLIAATCAAVLTQAPPTPPPGPPGGATACVEGVPGPVRKLKARAAGNTAVNFEFLPPRGDRLHGDTCVDYYERTVVETGSAPGPDDTQSGPLAPTGREGEFEETRDGLRPATFYRVSVRAVNAKFGPGPTTTAPVRTRGPHDDSRPPGAVLDFTVRETPARGARGAPVVFITWLPPRAGGWAESYEVVVAEAAPGGAAGRRVLETVVQQPEAIVDSGLRPGQGYEILVTAVNRSGRGPVSRVSYTTAPATEEAAPAAAAAEEAAPAAAARRAVEVEVLEA